jgi:tripartite-type tricarboxylate transporter receptor subunit TctC/uncharacterized protein YjiS (DUF1127 family)
MKQRNPTLESLKQAFQSLATEIRWWLAVRPLQRLDDGMLADIGVKRCEIEFVVRNGRECDRRSGRVRRSAGSPTGILTKGAGALASPMPASRLVVAWLSIGTLLSLALVISASAQPYPAKPIRLIVPFAPGGPTDISARIVADELSKSLSQSVLVDNRPGAGGNIGAEAAAKAAPDGYTLFWAQAATHGINPSLYRRLGYDAVKDFLPIALIVSEPLVLVTGAASPWVDVRGLIAAAKASPGKLHFGSGGIGTTPHMAGELFAAMAGANVVHVPYRGNAPAVTDTIAGRVEFMFDGINAAIGHIRGGTLKALAVTAQARTTALPDVPALAETLPDYEVLSWGGVVAPAGMPAEVITRLSSELTEIGRRRDVQQRFAGLGAHLQVSSPVQMESFIRSQIERWRKVISQTGIALD